MLNVVSSRSDIVSLSNFFPFSPFPFSPIPPRLKDSHELIYEPQHPTPSTHHPTPIILYCCIMYCCMLYSYKLNVVSSRSDIVSLFNFFPFSPFPFFPIPPRLKDSHKLIYEPQHPTPSTQHQTNKPQIKRFTRINL